MIDTRRFLLFLALGFVAIFVQGTLFREIAPHAVVPNFLLLMIVFLGFFEATIRGATLVFLLGVELDFASGLLVGPWAGAFIVSFGILASLSQRIFIESPLASVLAVFAGSIVSNFVYFVLVYEFHPSVTEVAPFSLLESALNALCAPFVFALLRGVVSNSSRGGAGRGWTARV
jgi:rod shape-determining protein MreD